MMQNKKEQNSKLVPLPLTLRIWRLLTQSHTQTHCYTLVEQEVVEGGGEKGERMSRDRLLPLVLGRESSIGCREM